MFESLYVNIKFRMPFIITSSDHPAKGREAMSEAAAPTRWTFEVNVSISPSQCPNCTDLCRVSQILRLLLVGFQGALQHEVREEEGDGGGGGGRVEIGEQWGLCQCIGKFEWNPQETDGFGRLRTVRDAGE